MASFTIEVITHWEAYGRPRRLVARFTGRTLAEARDEVRELLGTYRRKRRGELIDHSSSMAVFVHNGRLTTIEIVGEGASLGAPA
jgi:hypothetical protein